MLDSDKLSSADSYLRPHRGRVDRAQSNGQRAGRDRQCSGERAGAHQVNQDFFCPCDSPQRFRTHSTLAILPIDRTTSSWDTAIGQRPRSFRNRRNQSSGCEVKRRTSFSTRPRMECRQVGRSRTSLSTVRSLGHSSAPHHPAESVTSPRPKTDQADPSGVTPAIHAGSSASHEH